MRNSQQEAISRLEAIKREARDQARIDKYHCPVFVGALNTVEAAVYEAAYNEQFASEVNNEQAKFNG